MPRVQVPTAEYKRAKKLQANYRAQGITKTVLDCVIEIRNQGTLMSGMFSVGVPEGKKKSVQRIDWGFGL